MRLISPTPGLEALHAAAGHRGAGIVEADEEDAAGRAELVGAGGRHPRHVDPAVERLELGDHRLDEVAGRRARLASTITNSIAGQGRVAVVDELADVTLPDQDGNDVRLGDLWADGPVALVWLRHYG